MENQKLNVDMVAPGTVLNGQYKIVRRIASGSMGTVYLAQHLMIDGRQIAIKLISPKIVSNEALFARFKDELKATFEISHPNIIRTYDSFIHNQEVIGFSMEHASGGDLSRLIDREQPLPFNVIIEVLSQICKGLRAIHKAKIVHRDLKPENVLLSDDGTIKIADFGVALSNSLKRKTEDGVLLGVIDYLAPEYIEHNVIDARCDIYAVGMIAYKLISKVLPVEGKPFMESIRLKVKTDLPGPIVFRSDCPNQLNKIVLKAISRNPSERYQTIEEMLADLKRCQEQIYADTQIKQTREVNSASTSPVVTHRPKINVSSKLKAETFPLFRNALSSSSSRTTENFAPQFRQPYSRCAAYACIAVGIFLGTCLMPYTRNLENSYTVHASQPAKDSTSQSMNHIVKFQGETLSSIAQWYTGDFSNWRQIAEHNPGINPNIISIGDSIRIPSSIITNRIPLGRKG